MISLPGQMFLIHSTSFQDSAGSNCCAIQAASELTFSMPFTWPARLPKVLRLPFRMLQAQAGLVAMSMMFAEADFRRHRHAVLDVAVALAEHLQIDGQHQRVAFGLRRAVEDRLGEAAVLDDVELEPERLAVASATSSIEQIDMVESV